MMVVTVSQIIPSHASRGTYRQRCITIPMMMMMNGRAAMTDKTKF